MHASYCCACVASDGGQVSAPRIPDMRLPDDISKAMIQKSVPSQPGQTNQQAQSGAPKTSVAPGTPQTQQPQPPPQVESQPGESVVIQQPSGSTEMEHRIQKQPPPGTTQNGQGGFMSAVLNMLSALAKVVLLIFAIAGIYLAYKKLKPQLLHAATPKNVGKQAAPATVSEAVASYARHKLREH